MQQEDEVTAIVILYPVLNEPHSSQRVQRGNVPSTDGRPDLGEACPMGFSDHGCRCNAAVTLALICVADLETDLGMRPGPAHEQPGTPNQGPIAASNCVPSDTVLLAPGNDRVHIRNSNPRLTAARHLRAHAPCAHGACARNWRVVMDDLGRTGLTLGNGGVGSEI